MVYQNGEIGKKKNPFVTSTKKVIQSFWKRCFVHVQCDYDGFFTTSRVAFLTSHFDL
jgi:hypothetical protein